MKRSKINIIVENITLNSIHNPETPLFNHESCSIKVSLPSGYEKTFRKAVRWDFGDGTIIEAANAIHYYKNPGKYTIKCALYSIDRTINENIVVPVSLCVKETIPTELSFLNINSWKSEQFISKNCNLGKLQITIGNNVISEPKVSAIRRWPNGKNEYSYFDINKNIYYHFEKYYSFLEENISYSIDENYSQSILQPVNEYSPSYMPIYGKFIKNGEQLKLEAYIIASEYNDIYNNIDFRPYDPASMDGSRINTFKIIRKNSVKELPQDCTLIGKIAILDIWYKNDNISENSLIFEIDKDSLKFKDELIASESYLNIPPIGVTFKTVEPDTYVKGLTSNGIFSNMVLVDNNIFIGKHLKHNFYQNYTIEGYLSNFVKNDNLNNKESYNLLKSDSIKIISDDSQLSGEGCKIVSISNNIPLYLKCFNFTPINDYFTLSINDDVFYKHEKIVNMELLTLPSEKLISQEIDTLLDVYMQHPMYENAYNLKEFLYNIFSNKKILTYITSKGQNFFNDNTNYLTCYLDKFLSILDMLNESVKRYDINSFDKINDLREMTRIMTMNYTTLFGNILTNDYDIKITHASTGINVGDKLDISDTIYCDFEYNIIGIRRGANVYPLKLKTPYIIVKDDFTFKTCLNNFVKAETYTIELFEDQNEEWKNNNTDFINQVKYSYKFNDYSYKWGWGLNLPDETNNINNKEDIIDSYYSFYLFNPIIKTSRSYNFIEESTIPKSKEDPDKQITVKEWEEDFGFTYDCLMKILTYNLMLR